MVAVLKPTTSDTERGSRGYEQGLKQGANRILQSPVMEELALKITILETMVDVLSAAVKERDLVIGMYRLFHERDYYDNLP